MKYGGGSFFYRAGHFSITENLWKSDPGVIILYRIVTRGSLYPRVNILYDTGLRNEHLGQTFLILDTYILTFTDRLCVQNISLLRSLNIIHSPFEVSASFDHLSMSPRLVTRLCISSSAGSSLPGLPARSVLS